MFASDYSASGCGMPQRIRGGGRPDQRLSDEEPPPSLDGERGVVRPPPFWITTGFGEFRIAFRMFLRNSFGPN